MARIPLPVTGISQAGSIRPTPATADPAFGNSVANPGRMVLWITNVGDTSRTLDIRIIVTVDGQTVTPRTITIPAGATRICGPYDASRYGSTLLLDPESDDLRITALRIGDDIPVPASGMAFTAAGAVAIADLAYAGLSSTTTILTVDTVLTSSTIDGDALVVPVGA